MEAVEAGAEVVAVAEAVAVAESVAMEVDAAGKSSIVDAESTLTVMLPMWTEPLPLLLMLMSATGRFRGRPTPRFSPASRSTQWRARSTASRYRSCSRAAECSSRSRWCPFF